MIIHITFILFSYDFYMMFYSMCLIVVLEYVYISLKYILCMLLVFKMIPSRIKKQQTTTPLEKQNLTDEG